MSETASTTRIGEEGWVRTAARVLGAGVVLGFFSAVIDYLAFFSLSEGRTSLLLWLLVPVGILIAPAYGWAEFRGATRRNQRRPARAARVAAIFILVVNLLLLASAWVFYETFEHASLR